MKTSMLIRSVLILSFLLLFSGVQALTLEEALSYAMQRSGVVTAQLELADATLNLSRTESDPLRLKPDLVQARQRAALSQAQLDEAVMAALREISEAYTGVLEANEQVALAQLGLTLAEQSLNIAQIRVRNGSATQLDLQDAQVQVDDAKKNLNTATDGLEISRSNLQSMLGIPVTPRELESVPNTYLVALPSIETALSASTRHPQVLEISNNAEFAQLNVDLLDPSYASRVRIDNAKTQADSVKELATEVKRAYELQIRNLYTQVQTAAQNFNVQQEALRNANERLSFQQQRLDSGLISDLQFRQAGLDHQQAVLNEVSARDGYLLALLRLQEGSLVRLIMPIEAGN